MKLHSTLSDYAWDAWCIGSIIGIWPRFIEPSLLETTTIRLPIPALSRAFHGFKIVQFTDLHFQAKTSPSFLEKLRSRITQLEPDMIVFTGDFVCYSHLEEQERLLNFLKGLQAPHGCYAVWGNHDYAHFISLNEKGEYDVVNPSGSSIARGLKRLFSDTPLQKRSTAEALNIPTHAQLFDLVKQSPFQVLDNASIQISLDGSILNVCGLGEYMLGRCSPEKAFEYYDYNHPGIILLHNPDAAPTLRDYPGDIILSGHTHGGQIYLPWIWKKFALMENPDLLRGLIKVGSKWLYVNRGVGAVLPFRWRAKPEILCLTLESQHV